jgi:hypothetical protein
MNQSQSIYTIVNGWRPDVKSYSSQFANDPEVSEYPQRLVKGFLNDLDAPHIKYSQARIDKLGEALSRQLYQDNLRGYPKYKYVDRITARLFKMQDTHSMRLLVLVNRRACTRTEEANFKVHDICQGDYLWSFWLHENLQPAWMQYDPNLKDKDLKDLPGLDKVDEMWPERRTPGPGKDNAELADRVSVLTSGLRSSKMTIQSLETENHSLIATTQSQAERIAELEAIIGQIQFMSSRVGMLATTPSATTVSDDENSSASSCTMDFSSKSKRGAKRRRPDGTL